MGKAKDNIEYVEFQAVAKKGDLSGLTSAHTQLVKLKKDLDAINAAFGAVSTKSLKYTAEELKSILKRNFAEKTDLKPKAVASALGVPSAQEVKEFERQTKLAHAQQDIVWSQLQKHQDKVRELEGKHARARSAARKTELNRELKDARAQEEVLKKNRNDTNLFNASGNFTSAATAGKFSKNYFDDLNQRNKVAQQKQQNFLQALMAGNSGGLPKGKPAGGYAAPPPPPPPTKGGGTFSGDEEAPRGRRQKESFSGTMRTIRAQLAQDLTTGDAAQAYQQAVKNAEHLVRSSLGLKAGEEIPLGKGTKYDTAMTKAFGWRKKATNIETARAINEQELAYRQRQQKEIEVQAAAAAKRDGSLQQFINQRHAASGKAVDKDFWTTQYPPIVPDKSLQQFINQRHAAGGKAVDKDFWTKLYPPVPPPEKQPKTRWQNAVAGLSASNMAANILKVSEWALAVGVLYKAVNLAEYSLHRLIETGLETAHLSLVYRGVGGSVQALTSDIISLAAAQGRETSEAMESATEWARLGGDRKTINDEVRVSAIAANISGLKMTETTRQLSALMHIYGLESGDLNGVLGGLVNTTLKYNVTLEDLFGGLDRSAGAARLAGVSLAELQGMIGTVVGRTGQSGVIVGNTIKSLLVQFTNPEIQRQLRGFGIETLTNNLQQKPGGQVLGEIWEKWDTMSPRSQQGLTRTLVGRLGAARGVALFEGYAQSMKLAIDAQLNLNKAQEANVRILDTMKAQLAGVRANYDKLVVNSGAGTWATQSARTLKNKLGEMAGSDLPDAVQGSVMGEKLSVLQSKLDPKNNFNPQSLQEVRGEMARREVARAKRLGFSSSRGYLSSPYSQQAGTFDMRLNRPGFTEVDWYNAWQEYDPESARERRLNGRMQELAGHAQANVLRANFFSHVTGRLQQGGALRPDEMQAIADSMADPKQAGQFKAAWRANDRGGLLQISSGAAATAMKDYQGQQIALNEEHAKAVAELRGEMEKNQHLKDTTPEGTEQHEAAVQALEKQEKSLEKINQSHAQQVALLDEERGKLEEVMEKSREYSSFLAAQGDALERIKNLHSLVTAPTQGMALQQTEAGAQAQLKFLDEQDAAADRMVNDTERESLKKQIFAARKQAESTLDTATNPYNRSLANLHDAGERGVRAAGYVGLASDYGMNPGDRLLRQRSGLQADIADHERQMSAATSLVEKSMLTNKLAAEQKMLFENGLALAERRVAVERDINQLYFDRNREMRRNVLGGGPSELLRTLAAFRTAFDDQGKLRNISSGQQLSWDPRFRSAFNGAVGAANPGDRAGWSRRGNLLLDPELIELNQERNRLNQPVTDMPGGAWNKALGEIGGVIGQISAGMKAFTTAMDYVGQFGDKLNWAAAQLETFVSALNGIQIGGGSGASPGTAPVIPAGQGWQPGQDFRTLYGGQDAYLKAVQPG